MWSDKNRRLLSALSQGFEHADDAHQFLQTGVLKVHGIPFTLIQAAGIPDSIDIHAHFGPPPENQKLAVLQRLLEINLLLPLDAAARLALDAESGDIIFSYRWSGDELAALFASLQMTASQAQAWHEDYFLDEVTP